MNIKSDDIAVIGMSGRFPGANSVSEFWDNLCARKESIRSLSDEELRSAGVPEGDIADPAYVKASALIDDVDRFDPGFFKISPLEAELMDPQIRLLLQCAWETLEDAGHARKEAQNIGVFAGAGGVTTGYFANFINVSGRFEKITAGATHLGNDKDFLSTYISYKLNLTGPSMTVQTACSTSLVALHQARQSLLAGECDMALAGGVTVRVPHVQGYHYREGYIFSKSGRVMAFDERADGVVFGSGLGLVLLKRLSDAIADGDNIHAVIKGSAIVNDGKGKMSYAASSARGQIACVRAALKSANVEAESIRFVESHGTGTAMGDPEEVKALSAAFREQTDKKTYCALGAVKTNVGHLEAAAGIVGFIKTVLAVKHGVIPPTALYQAPNPRIKFDGTPFYVNTALQKWSDNKKPRRAAVNSLGVGGTNAFVVLENHADSRSAPKTKKGGNEAVVVPLSARTDASLRTGAARLAAFLAAAAQRKQALDLHDLAHTLQSGRDTMECRAAFVVATTEALQRALERFLRDEPVSLPPDDNGALATAWLAGEDVSWNLQHPRGAARRISLPTYAFAKERYWIDDAAATARPAVLHPLLHANTSDLNEQKYSSRFSGEEFFLRDHRVRTRQHAESGALLQKVLPGVAYLEMARAAIEQAAPIHRDAGELELHDIVWLQPIAVAGETGVHIALVSHQRTGAAPRIDFEVYTQDDQIHCQGRGTFSAAPSRETRDLSALRAAMQRSWNADAIYRTFAAMGLDYGPAHRAVVALSRNDSDLLAQLALPAAVAADAADFLLHPSLMDGAFQAATLLLFDPDSAQNRPAVPFAVDSVRVVAPCTRTMTVWARYAEGSQPGDKAAKIDIDLLDDDGAVCVRIRGFLPRVLGRQTLGSLLMTQEWQPGSLAVGQAAPAEQHVVLCGLPQVEVSRIARDCTLLPCDQDLNLAQRYTALALACAEKLQALLRSRPQGKTLVQIALPDSVDNAVYAGLAGLLKTARLENPQIYGQLVLVDAEIDTDALAALLQAERGHPHDTLVRYRDSQRQVAQWRFLSGEGCNAFDAGSPFKDRGVYLITGGLGGLGALFAREIIARASNATIVLSGRATLDELRRSPQRLGVLESLQGLGATVEYLALDLADGAQVQEAIYGIVARHGRLNGILHSAGMTADGFLLKKPAEEFRRVLAPKVDGTWHLDQATRELDLDFLVLFSSLSSALGNLGQADYAAANGFLDEFAGWRNRLVEAGERRGATLALRWPLWHEGGMQLDAAARDQLHDSTGIYPMRSATGLRMFYRSLALGLDQTLVMEGDLNLMQRALGIGAAIHAVPGAAESARDALPADTVAVGGLAERCEAFLCAQLSALLKLPVHKVDATAALEDYGIDSILALDLTRLLEASFGPLPKTLFFEYLSLRELAGYFVATHALTLAKLFAGADGDSVEAAAAAATAAVAAARSESVASIRCGRRDRCEPAVARDADAFEAIAIVGLAGRYPQSRDLAAYWRNLRDGKDCIVEVPPERWDWRDYYSEDRSEKGRHYSRWGGFIEGVDEFDARFFNISPPEAETMDPQERLFLQHAWMAMEDAGYTRAALQIPNADDLPAQVGVYAGVMYGEYQLLGAEASLLGQRMGFASNLAGIANRVSYALNLHGPSMAVDTMCSSSLTAIHLACQDLKLGRTALAIAGGVNVTIHPNKYLMLSAGQFISGDGHCQSFGEGGDGYIPGEGVGVVVLKRLSEAQRDGNRIYGVIRGSALSHGGKTNGYTVPNPQAQASAIRQALAQARIAPRRIGYIEAHGTGTRLGDPIEIAALNRVFQESIPDTGFCPIGSAKSNIGHAEAAAGIAGLTKVLLQLQHGEIVPSLHSARLNPHIDFDSTAFVVNQTLRPWPAQLIEGRALPRIAGISSFGAGGSNAHLIVEEYLAPAAETPADGVVHIVPLSARTPAQLKQKARELVEFLAADERVPALAAVAFTLQAGREAMDQRLAVIAGSVDELLQRLRAWLDESAVDGVHSGQLKGGRGSASLPEAESVWMATATPATLAEAWVQGQALNWSAMHAQRPALVSLPAYPFARQRHWIDVSAAARRSALLPQQAPSHPLLQQDCSDLEQQRYRSTFDADAFFLTGEAGARTLNAAACLEMARTAVARLLPQVRDGALLELRNIAWGAVAADIAGKPVTVSLFDRRAQQLAFEISVEEGASEIVLCQGHAAFAPAPASDLPAAASRVELTLASALEAGRNDYVLHPALLQQALHAHADALPQTLASLRLLRSGFVAASARSAVAADGGMDIDLCDAQGQVCVQLRGLRHAVATAPAVASTLAAVVPVAPATAAPAPAPAPAATAAPLRVNFHNDAFALAIPATAVSSKPKASIVLRALTAAPVVTAAAIAAKPRRPLVAAAASADSPLALFDQGGGVFALEISRRAGRDGDIEFLVNELLRALRYVAAAPAAKVLCISDRSGVLAAGGASAHAAALESGLYRALAQFPYPLVAVVEGEALGAGFLLAALADFLLCSDTARLGFALPQQGLYPAAAEALLIERFGRVAATDLLYLHGSTSAAELAAAGWRCRVVPAAELATQARQLSLRLAQASQDSLRLLKAHLSRSIAAAVQALPPPAAAVVVEETSPLAVEFRGRHLRLEIHGHHTALVRVLATQGSAAELLHELREVFGQLNANAACRSVVLASELPGFLPDFADGNAIARELAEIVLGLDCPVVAAVGGDAVELAWFAALLCEACVYTGQGRYRLGALLQDPTLASAATALLALRAGDEAARSVLLAGADCDGVELRRAGFARVVEPAQVEATALTVAASLAALPRAPLAAWKAGNTAWLQSATSEFPFDKAATVPTPGTIALASTVISAQAHADGVLEVRMADRAARNMFSNALSDGLRELFAHVEASGAYKAVVLHGYDTYFALGGTPETLLAIQQGRMLFTDDDAFQLPLRCSVPVIAAMQGHGIGAGWALGLYADMALYAQESRYSSPYMGYGFTPGAGSTLLFPARLGHDLARESLLTAQEYAGADLAQRGIAAAVLPREQVAAAALQLAHRIARQPLNLLRALKRHWAAPLRAALADTFERELAMHAQTFVGQADTLARIQHHFAAEVAPVAVAPARVEPAAAASAAAAGVADAAALVPALRQLLAHELRMDESEIGEDEPFVDLGLDSITGVTWIRRINERYGTQIEAIKVYSHPTLAQLARFVAGQMPAAAAVVPTPETASTVQTVVSAASVDDAAIVATLRQLLAHELRMDEAEIAEDEPFVDLGLDSITGVTWIRRINEHYGTQIEAIKVYSHPTLVQLARFVGEEMPQCEAAVAAAPAAPAAAPIAVAQALPTLRSWRHAAAAAPATAVTATAPSPTTAIAVIGMSGRFAQSPDLATFWQNIAAGRDCIAEIPSQRWDIERHYQAGDAAPGKTYARWMGALDDHDRFDAAFFAISPREAKSMDPQQRVFLEACWHGLEHAGYNPKALGGSRCGVFAGVSAGDYHQLSRREALSGQGFIGASTSILAARIAYYLDLHGPALAIDTACSSSLVAIATACDSLASGGSDIALAGGVNVMAGPAMQIMTAQVGMLSPQGRCFSFDARADGIVNGEGVGVVVLKRLADAQRDGDCIYGVVEGWGVNQDGRTNGITAPNADSQTRLQREVYARFGIDPAGIQLVEAHGTGTPLGDPIEVAGLKAAFGTAAGAANCALGSVKSNIGHCLTAAGVSGFLKLLLALQHRQLPPTIHFDRLNPHISLQDSPFYISERLRDWPRAGTAPRRAAINSFGFSGTNAHVVLAEYIAPAATKSAGAQIVPLSARTPEQLRQQAQALLLELRRPEANADLGRIAYTLQRGREAMTERVAFVATTTAELERLLQAFLQRDEEATTALPAAIHRASVGSGRDSLPALGSDPDFQAMIAKWIARQELPRLADLWVKGLALDWNAFHAVPPQRLALPQYPFARERYWIDDADAAVLESAATVSPLPQMQSLAAVLPMPSLQRAAVPAPALAAVPTYAPAAAPATIAQPAAAITQPAGPSLESLQQQLLASLAEALFMQPSDVDVRKSFTELGLDSIIGVEWVKALNKHYGCELSATRIYDYPSVAELAAYLHAQLFSAVAMAAAPQTLATPAAATAPAAVETKPPISTTVPAIAIEELRQQLKTSLAEALFMQSGDIDSDKSFTELGLDSIIGVEWVKQLNRQYGTTISATRVYDYPSVRELAAYLQGEMPRTETAQPVAPATVVAVAAVVPVAALPEPAPVANSTAGFPFRFEPKFTTDYRSLYFHCAEGEGDWEADGEFAVRCRLNPDSNVSLQEHVVFGEHLLPTDAYIELVAAAFRSWFAPAPFCLRQIAIANPLIGNQGRDTYLKIVFRRAGEALQFFVKSSATADFAHDTLNLQGFIASAEAVPALAFDESFAVERTLAAAEIATNAGRYYAPLASLQFGANAALGQVRVAVHDFAFLANPFALYGGLCTVINHAAYVAARHYGDCADQFLPYRIGRLSLYAALQGSEYQCRAQLRAHEHDALEFDLELVDATGTRAALIESVVLRRVAAATLRQAVATLPAPVSTALRSAAAAPEKVAIIGMSGRFPQSANVEAFWQNLVQGRDCVVEVPAQRWGEHSDWYHPDPRHAHTSYSKWAGLLDGIDQFDPLFFGISPAEAELIDPQQRIFLEECWKTIESAGYAPGSLSQQACGVYVGCSTGDYARVLGDAGQDTAGAAFMGTSNAILAARIAYHLNLKGPALAIDTACSSSLVAVHLACESIRSGENRLALAGGINLLTTPLGHILTSQVGMPSRDGRCAAFDASANGIVFSEGCGVLLLKAYSDAIRDNDDILGVIEGSGSNQDGKTNGITAPSSRAQEQLLRQVYAKFDIDPRRIGYVEAHGTATALGDPIEVNALSAALGVAAGQDQRCALGSVKSNIGHTGFAAGVAGMVKALMCLRQRKLVPSIHYSQPNPHIDFDASPLRVNTDYRDWTSDSPRLAAVSSFGFSGTNAHVVIAEHVPARQTAAARSGLDGEGRALLPLSAKTAEQLQQKVRELLAFLSTQEQPPELARLAYTLQLGRDAMDYRCAFVAGSVAALCDSLQVYLDGGKGAGIWRGQASRADDTLAAFAGDADLRALVERWVAQKNLAKVAELWVRGLELDLGRLHDGEKPRRLRLPTYPFAQERCWIAPAAATAARGGGIAALHPLLQRNISDLGQQSYASRFDGSEFFLAHHRVNGQPVLPAVAYLEMARAALQHALPATPVPVAIALRHVAWSQPLRLDAPREVEIAVYSESNGELAFEVYSRSADGGEETLHCQGSGSAATPSPAPQLDLARLRAQLPQPRDVAALYAEFAALGLDYGAAFQGIAALRQGTGQVLVELALPTAASAAGFLLHPSVLDSALQGSIVLLDDAAKPALPFALESLQVYGPCPSRLFAWVRTAAAASAALVKVDIDLCDAEGKVCVQMRGFSSRPLEAAAAFDEAHYQSVIAGVLNRELSADAAVELG